MSNEPSPEQAGTQIRDIILKTLKEQIFSNAELTDDQKAEQSYQLMVVALANFLAQTKLQFRVLMETRSLESALKSHVSHFDINLVAKPKTNTAVDSVLAENAAEKKSEPATEGLEISNEPAQAGQN